MRIFAYLAVLISGLSIVHQAKAIDTFKNPRTEIALAYYCAEQAGKTSAMTALANAYLAISDSSKKDGISKAALSLVNAIMGSKSETGLFFTDDLDLDAVYAAYESGEGVNGDCGESNQMCWYALWLSYYALLDILAILDSVPAEPSEPAEGGETPNSEEPSLDDGTTPPSSEDPPANNGGGSGGGGNSGGYWDLYWDWVWGYWVWVWVQY